MNFIGMIFLYFAFARDCHMKGFFFFFPLLFLHDVFNFTFFKDDVLFGYYTIKIMAS